MAETLPVQVEPVGEILVTSETLVVDMPVSTAETTPVNTIPETSVPNTEETVATSAETEPVEMPATETEASESSENTDESTVCASTEIPDEFDVNSEIIYIHNKLYNHCFINAELYSETHTIEDMNIHLNTPVYVQGKLSLSGNTSLNSYIGAVSDLTVSDGNLNANNAVIYSKFGDINLSGSQVSVSGLIYAPLGTVTINADNFNLNGIILAQKINITCGWANINYNSQTAELIGVDSEDLDWTEDDFQYLADTDGDGLPNIVEKELGTDAYNPDTDGDLLPDGYELYDTYTNPLKWDTDDDGISDGEKDFDDDGLTNYEEFLAETKPYYYDTDFDNLSDGDEININFTNPLNKDSDKDGLDDDDELVLGTDPLNPDTNGNGILDGKEKFQQIYVHEVLNEDCAVSEVSVSMNATGNLQKTMEIKSVMGIDVLSSEVVGLVGEPFDITTTSEFDSATISFKVDKEKLGEATIDNLIFLWYDEENRVYREMETVIDSENNTVSTTTTHFSTYMLVDSLKWFEAWRNAPDYSDYVKNADLDMVLAIDVSGSMSTSAIQMAVQAAQSYVETMAENERASVVKFNSSATVVCAMTNDKTKLLNALSSIKYGSGGTNFDKALTVSLNQYNSSAVNKNMMLFLSDGSASISSKTISAVLNSEVVIYTVGIGNANESVLKQIANISDGEYFKADSFSDLYELYTNVGVTKIDLGPDTDGDGLADIIEKGGMLVNATRLHLDPDNPDTDGDGLKDGEEIKVIKNFKELRHEVSQYMPAYTYVFDMVSDPRAADTDNTGISDYDRSMLKSNPDHKLKYEKAVVAKIYTGDNKVVLNEGDVFYSFADSDSKIVYTVDESYASLYSANVLLYAEGKLWYKIKVPDIYDTWGYVKLSKDEEQSEYIQDILDNLKTLELIKASKIGANAYSTLADFNMFWYKPSFNTFEKYQCTWFVRGRIGEEYGIKVDFDSTYFSNSPGSGGWWVKNVQSKAEIWVDDAQTGKYKDVYIETNYLNIKPKSAACYLGYIGGGYYGHVVFIEAVEIVNNETFVYYSDTYIGKDQLLQGAVDKISLEEFITLYDHKEPYEDEPIFQGYIQFD